MPKGEKPAIVVDHAEWKNRLLEACAIHHAPPNFKPGDVLTHNPALYPKDANREANDHGIAPLVVVIETRPSWRALLSSQESPDMPANCQAVCVGQFDTTGMFITMWTGSVFFILAPEEMLRSPGVGANLNH